MRFRTLIRRNLRFHWRAHLGVVLGAAVGSAALIGALVVGDSVKESLRERALRRLGGIHFVLSSQDRFFSVAITEKLAVTPEVFIPMILKGALTNRLTLRQETAPVSAGLLLSGVASRQDGGARINNIQIIGIDPWIWPFLANWKIFPPDPADWTIPADWKGEAFECFDKNFWMGRFSELSSFKLSARVYGWTDAQQKTLLQSQLEFESWLRGESAFVNQTMATRLGLRVGDTLLIRLRKPAAFPGETPLSPREPALVSLRVKVGQIVPPDKLGDFSMAAAPDAEANVFFARDILAQEIGEPGSANLLLQGALAVKPEWGRLRKAFYDLRMQMRRRFPKWIHAPSAELSAANSAEALNFLKREFSQHWQLIDAQVVLRVESPIQAVIGLDKIETHVAASTPRVFLDPPFARAALAADTNAQPILTYLATLVRSGTNATPYSMVTAVGPPWTPADLRDDEILVSRWLAEDLEVKPGDAIELSYFLPESGAKLIEATNTFRVRAVVPMEMPWADRTLMPDFPGLEKAESTRDWDAGFPLTYKIRQKDEDYWKKYRGTPKAFITLAAGQKMWANRFGELTAIRFPIPGLESRLQAATNSTTRTPDRLKAGLQTAEDYRAALEKRILATLKPEELGLRFEPVREQALKAAEESQDFGGLFLGFSFFLIAAALLLMALLFSLGLEQRAPEIGTLLVLGFTPKQVRRLLLREGVALSFLGGIIGALGGLAYAKAMLLGLTTIWRDAVGASALNFHFTGQTLVVGVLASTAVCVATIWLTLRKLVRRPATQLLAGEIRTADPQVQSLSRNDADEFPGSAAASAAVRRALAPNLRAADALIGSRSRPPMPTTRASSAAPEAGALPIPTATFRLRSKVVASGALAAALVFIGWALVKGDTANAGAFFGAGTLVLVAGSSFAGAWLESKAGVAPAQRVRQHEQGKEIVSSADFVGGGRRDARPALSLASLAVRGCARRRKRSLATVAMLACGSFLIVSIGVFRLDADRDATERTSGTGGFALIGATTMPVVQDLNSQSGREFFALNENDLTGVSFVPFRVREGDEASCLNLNRAQKPRLLGVRPEFLGGRFAFAKGAGWNSLRSSRRKEAHSEITNSQSPIADNDQTLLTSAATSEDTVHAIGDANSIQWAMHKKVGDTIDYVDERGQSFKVRIAGAVANSILQGSLIIDEAEFIKRFPSESGYRMFLIDAPSNRVAEVSVTLSRAMQDVGLELTPAPQRLNEFNAVQNTYLSTFQVLGGLGLLLGSAGLGVVVMRNVLERRGEFGLMLAVGFRKRALQWLVLSEHGALLGLGLSLGIVAAAVAVLPSLLSPGTELPYGSLAITLAAVLANGALWTWLATRYALRGNLLEALRNE